MSRPTIADIARRAGVSKGAVSFALNGRSGVSAATRERILSIADELNWRPHSAARALGGARVGAVGLVLARPGRTLGVEPFFGQLLSGLEGELSQRGFALQLMIVESLDAEIAVYRRWAAEHRVDGLLLVDPHVDDPRPTAVTELGIPAVVIGGPDVGALHCVWADDRAAMWSVMRYVAALGHRRIARVCGPQRFVHTHRRSDVVAAAAVELALEPVTTVETDFSAGAGADATRRLLSQARRPTVIVYDSDVMAVAGLGVAMEMGVSVPADLSLVSFDDSALTQITHPSITALARDTFAFGASVAMALLAVLDAPATAADVETPTPTLVVRESTAPPRRASAVAGGDDLGNTAAGEVVGVAAADVGDERRSASLAGESEPGFEGR